MCLFGFFALSGHANEACRRSHFEKRLKTGLQQSRDRAGKIDWLPDVTRPIIGFGNLWPGDFSVKVRDKRNFRKLVTNA